MNKLLTMILLNKLSKSSGGGVTPTGTISITENGEYDVTNYAGANVNVESEYNAKVLTDAIYDADISYPNLKQIIVECPTINLGDYTTCQGFFNNCFFLQKIELFDTSKVTNMKQMFQNCKRLTSIPQFNTSKVTDMSTMFQNCIKLETVPILDTHLVSPYYMQNMFQSCLSLTNESLNNILYMIAHCGSGSAYRTLQQLGLSQSQATTCTGLSNWASAQSAGWSTGY